MTVGTGLKSILMLKKQSAIATLGTGQREVYLRPLSYSFNRTPNLVTSDYATSKEIGITKEISHFVPGSLRFDLDTTTIVDMLELFLGSLSTAQAGATSEYLHTLKFGALDAPFKYFKAFVQQGGLATKIYRNFIGNAISQFSIFVPRMDVAYCDIKTIGQTNEVGAIENYTHVDPDSITTTYTADEQTVAWGGFYTYVGTAGATAILGTPSGSIIGTSNQWKDPFSCTISMSRDVNADNFISDQLGYTDDIVDGKVRSSVNFVTKLRSTHKIATFEAGTEVSLGIILDTGLAIPSGNGSNYKMELIFPRCKLVYSTEINSEGTIEPVVDFYPMIDKTAGYSMKIIVYNNTSSYPAAT